ncbi:MAG: DUF4433 domain-containing protein [Candidatus Thermoplasmatota archaeon]|nr:DUF4433 domain-containing protein [Candidatus Thermoplasmatota archaeon]MBU1913581.1 DUF4433 domain-containing protein [Candidatus Thermoplasmatota archaeon]
MPVSRSRTYNVRQLFYIAPAHNVPSILQRGILSHAKVEEEGIGHETIYDESIVTMRGGKQAPSRRLLREYANLFFQPKNAMLLRVLGYRKAPDLAIIGVDRSVLDIPGVFVTNGLAARSETRFHPGLHWRRVVYECEQALVGGDWSTATKSRRMAECLVPDVVPSKYIQMVYVPSIDAKNQLKSLCSGSLPSHVEIVADGEMFFLPRIRSEIGEHLVVRDGNMFLSGMQTLTISVNCVGVMGKGLASKAKYLFPDVYGVYKDLCQKHQLRLGEPYLYKREESYDLLDTPEDVESPNDSVWFLLFPTKGHWSEKASLVDIEKGLEWLVDNYEGEGIESLAVPALGCGLGGLRWEDVSKVLYRHLGKLSIPVEIYRPA